MLMPAIQEVQTLDRADMGIAIEGSGMPWLCVFHEPDFLALMLSIDRAGLWTCSIAGKPRLNSQLPRMPRGSRCPRHRHGRERPADLGKC